MPNIEDFEAWVKAQGGQTGLAAKFKRKFGKEVPVSQTVISNWVTRRRVPAERRDQLEILGWPGPYEWPQEAQEAPVPTGGPYATASALETAVAVLNARDEWLKAEIDPLRKLVQDLDRRVQELERQRGLRE